MHLFRWKIKPNNLCTFCQHGKEDVSHFFWDCKEAQNCWEWVKDICQTMFKTNQLKLTKENVLLNRIMLPPAHVFNFICLIAKKYMYTQRCKQKPMSKQALTMLVEKFKRYELYYAKKHDKSKIHCKKWLIHDSTNRVIHNGTNLETNYVLQYINEM